MGLFNRAKNPDRDALSAGIDTTPDPDEVLLIEWEGQEVEVHVMPGESEDDAVNRTIAEFDGVG